MWGGGPFGQSWATFLRNHAHETWACDFLQLTDVRFRPLFAFFLVELASRRVVQVGVTRRPTDAWVTQQLREATPFDERPRLLIRDNDAKYGMPFAQLAEASGITVLRTPVPAPRANAITERFLRSVRGSASITCSCSVSSTSAACSASMSRTSIRPGRTKGWVSACPCRAHQRL